MGSYAIYTDEQGYIMNRNIKVLVFEVALIAGAIGLFIGIVIGTKL